jgi:3-hydroxyisobutyrate dehydrogenase-like beta-hydroxyacid dehydrogenase
MGRPMSEHVLAAGHRLTVFDADSQAMAPLVQAGASAAASLTELAEVSDVILLIVPTDEDVLEVAEAMLEGARPNTVIAICSSTRPETCIRAAALATPHSVGVVDAPVARGVRGAQAGDLTVFAGGEAAEIEKCRPVFDAFAGHVFHMGPLGAGQITKTANNLIHWLEVVGIYEALRLGAASGVHPNKLRPALLAGSVESRTLRELDLVGLAWPHKDMENALEMAAASDTRIPLMEKVGELVVQMSRDDLRALFIEQEYA